MDRSFSLLNNSSETMEELFKSVALPIALVAEAAAVLIVAYGVIEALLRLLSAARSNFRGVRKKIWLGLAVWLLLGLEFELAADIVRSVISADWPDIARLGAIAAIRTFLNYFLEKDLEKYGDTESRPA